VHAQVGNRGRSRPSIGFAFEEILVVINVLAPNAVLAPLESARDSLGGQGVNLFRAALNKSKSDLLDRFIRPNLITPDHSYIYIAKDNGGIGSRPNYDPGNSLNASMSPNDDDLALPGLWGLFTNPLGWTGIDSPGPKPSERAINIGFCVYTLEFDKLTLREQLHAICGGGLGRTDKILQRFKDYRGYEVVYGGRKSVHFHFLFDLRHWNHDLAFAGNSAYQDHWRVDFPDCYLRAAHADRWAVIQAAFHRGTRIDAEPDPQLRYWEQNRRLPLALRLVHDNHPLRLPAGSYVRQYVLTSSIRKHIPRQGKSWLHFDGLVKRAGRRAAPTRVVRQSDRAVVDGVASGDQGRFDEFLAENFPKLTAGSDLRYAGVELNGRDPTIHVFNNAADRAPSSIMRGDHDAVLLQGAHQFDNDILPLGVSPNRLYEAMVEHDTGSVESSDHILDQIFQAEVHDLDSYRCFLSDHIGAAMKAADLLLILGPEGCGKSLAVMGQIHQLIADTGGPVFISSPSYAQAAEKMREFTATFWGTPYVAFEYLSLTELYRRSCPSTEYISEIDALDMGCSSWLATIFHEQPEVYAKMRAYRDQLHAIRERGQIPVMFGVHETIRRYANTGMTRLFYAKGFDERWFGSMDPDARRKYRNALRFESAIAHVVFDEVSPADLVSIHGEEIVRWAHRYEHSVQHLNEWDKIGRYIGFKKFCSKDPRPREGDEATGGKSDWQIVQEILHSGYEEDDLVSARTDRFPFDDDRGMYKERLGDSYFVRPREWWTRLAPTTLLTTELVPAQIVEAFRLQSTQREAENSAVGCPDALNDDGDGVVEPYRVFRFDRPGLFKDFVFVENHRDAKRETLPGLVRRYVERFPDTAVISDMIGGRVDDKVEVTTHLSARGSNDLHDRDIIAFYTAPSPGLFGQLTALDTRLGTLNTIALWYVDRFNQTCGRNRGFRSQYKRRHIAVMGHRMYSWLAPYLVTWSRYACPRRRCSLT
jgi:hypothetical protein